MSKELISTKDIVTVDPLIPKVDCMRDCPDLGHCCKRFVLTTFSFPPFDEGRSLKGVRRKLRQFKLPFEVLELSADNNSNQKTAKKVWWFTCPVLGKDGRCGDYENRPRVCKSFVPGGGDELCLIKPEKKEGGEAKGVASE
ncbi:YkgJ family cysteine cluster protein [Candidatus Pacearchaeota archaeon]|nr:YkgJ family cysteine cluster protein [Candidatus Pacearchaeota archaeon]